MAQHSIICGSTSLMDTVQWTFLWKPGDPEGSVVSHSFLLSLLLCLWLSWLLSCVSLTLTKVQSVLWMSSLPHHFSPSSFFAPTNTDVLYGPVPFFLSPGSRVAISVWRSGFTGFLDVSWAGQKAPWKSSAVACWVPVWVRRQAEAWHPPLWRLSILCEAEPLWSPSFQMEPGHSAQLLLVLGGRTLPFTSSVSAGGSSEISYFSGGEFLLLGLT